MTNDVKSGDRQTIESSERAKNRRDRARVRGIAIVALDPDTVATPISDSLHLMTAFVSGVLCVRAAAVTKRSAKRQDTAPQANHLGEGALSAS